MGLRVRHLVLCMFCASAPPGATSTVKLLYVFRNEDKCVYVIRQILVSVHFPRPSTFLFFYHQLFGQVAPMVPPKSDMLMLAWGLLHVL